MKKRLIIAIITMVFGISTITLALNQPSSEIRVDTKYIKININSGIHHAFARAFNCQHDRAMEPMEELYRNAKYLSDEEINRFINAWEEEIIKGLDYKAKDIIKSDGPATAQMWYDLQILTYKTRINALPLYK